MIIVGELINASRKKIAAAIESQDTETIQTIAKDQHENGANYIDVNAGVFVGKEPEYLQWLTSTVQAAVDTPCCIDSPDPKAIEAALTVHNGTPMINSISLEKERYEALLPIVAGTDFKVVALCMSDKGMPKTTDERMGIANELVNNLVKNNVPVENIYVDPLVQPISTNDNFGVEFLNSIENIIKAFPGIHTVCGLSNISFGLPERKFLNQTFMVMAITRGLDGAIVDPLDKKMMANIVAAEALAGNDEWCSAYLEAYRAKSLNSKTEFFAINN
ncbi:MAG: methyltetrahydrofolate cobalamin methyltransferase [Desulfobacterales bacterium]|nr:methyltetrahydrofolate cobalamin methyltransferase [Desulfobacterales bacterium]